MSSTSPVRYLVRSYPITSTAVATGTFLVAGAFGIEHYSNHWGASPMLPRHYDWNAIDQYWMARPVTAVKRVVVIFRELGPVAAFYIKDFVLTKPTHLHHYKGDDDKSEDDTRLELQRRHAAHLREALTNLGPAFIKAGQQLSIRPDLVPPVVLKELQKLCDAVRPIDDEAAMQVIQDELKTDRVDLLFENITLVASASLGQVYKAKLRSTGKQVAIKVQRPNMRQAFSLDLFLLQRFGVVVDLFTSTFTNQPPFHKALYESFSSASYAELDYCQEAANQKRFKTELAARKCKVVVPTVYDDYTSEKVLTSQWIEGVKLADSSRDQIRKLIPVGVELFLTQLLDIGAFHADPHPGNLLVDRQGNLCLLDFGLCAEVDEKSRNAVSKAIVHLLYRDFDSLVSEDAIELGFLPADFDTTELKPLLSKILTVAVVDAGSNLNVRKKKLMDISNELNEVFFKYPFSVPPFFALVTRGLGLLEGIALTGDPDFDIFRASAPFARRRAVAILGAHSFRGFTHHDNSRRLTATSGV